MKILMILFLLTLPVTLQAKGLTVEEQCQNPALLSPELREAYYQLKELENQIEGMTVRIRCEKKEYTFEELMEREDKVVIKVIDE